MKLFTVYCHTLMLDGRKYVGITSQKPQKRWSYGSGYSGTYFGNAIKKYGWNNFKHEILFTNLTEEDACNKEQELIKKWKLQDKSFGFNLCGGGEGTNGYAFTDKDREKMRLSHIGKKHTPSQVKKIKKSLKNYYKTHTHKVSQETIEKMRQTKKSQHRVGVLAWNYGKHLSDNTKEKLRKANLGKKTSMETRQKMSNSSKKVKVDMLNRDGEFIMTFDSIVNAEKFIKSSCGHITECAKGLRKTVKNYKWRYTYESIG